MLGSIKDLYRIGTGPSSSHTMGPRRAAGLFLQRNPDADRFTATLFGSLACTGKGHLTDKAIHEAFGNIRCDVAIDETTGVNHPNTLKFEAFSADTLTDSWTVVSIGGGALADETGLMLECNPVEYPVSNIAGALAWCKDRGHALWALPEQFESDLYPWLEEVWRAMKASVQRGLESHHSTLPGGLSLPRKAESAYARARSLQPPLRDMGLMTAYALAVSEENAAGGVVVTAPTCGASGVLPGVLFYFMRDMEASERQILRALATAGLFGNCVKANASIAGSEVGCQGEVGVGCAMAAAAAAQLLGGSPWHIEYAAEMALEHHLGLTCDPVMGLVQIPCIERNAVAATRALDCAAYSLLGDGRHAISFDEIVEVMHKTGRDIQSSYRETSKGGLAELWHRKQLMGQLKTGG